MATAIKEEPKTFWFRDWSKGMNQTASRPALDDKESYWLENAQPIGPGQLTILPPAGATLASISAGIATFFGVTMKIGGVSVARLITVNTDGSMTAVNPVSGAKTTIAAPGIVTTAARVTMFQDNPLLIGDPTKGYFSWDGTTLNKYPIALTGSTHTNKTLDAIAPNTTGLAAGMAISSASDIPAGTTIASVDSATQVTLSAAATASNAGEAITVGAGAPTAVTDLATFEGRVCLVTATRSITLTAPASYTDFTTADGALVVTITDSVFAGSITKILSALEVLWVIGPSAVNALSNVQIASGVTTVSNTNIVSNVGTLLASSISSFFRTFLMLASYGVYAIVGATPQKLSEQLDGLFPNLSFGTDEPSGVVAINNVFVWCVQATYTNPVTKAVKTVLLCFSRNAWFVASQGTLTWIASLVNLTTGAPELWGTDGTNIFKCFGGTGAGFYDIQTKFYDFGQFTTRKQMLRLGVELQNTQATFVMTAKVSNELLQSQTVTLGVTLVTLSWTGAGGLALTFTGSGAVAIVWLLASASPEGTVDMAGDYLAVELTGTSLPFTISGMAMQVKALGGWT